jgi:hypothetical protein
MQSIAAQLKKGYALRAISNWNFRRTKRRRRDQKFAHPEASDGEALRVGKGSHLIMLIQGISSTFCFVEY